MPRTIYYRPSGDGRRFVPEPMTVQRSRELVRRLGRLGAMVSGGSSVAQLVAAAASAAGVDPALALAVAQQESGFNQNKISSAGAIVVMQLMPATASGLGVDPHNMQQNITGGVRYLAQLISQFGDYARAVAAYNAGPGAVSATSGPGWLNSLPAETQAYVPKVLALAGGNYLPAFQQSLSPEAQPPANSPDSFSATITPTADQAAMLALPAGVDWGTLLVIGGIALGLYFLTDVFE